MAVLVVHERREFDERDFDRLSVRQYRLNTVGVTELVLQFLEALDVETGKLVLEALQRANRELRTTTVVITHNVAIAAMADRVLRMRNGMIVESTTNTAPVDPATLVW